MEMVQRQHIYCSIVHIATVSGYIHFGPIHKECLTLVPTEIVILRYTLPPPPPFSRNNSCTHVQTLSPVQRRMIGILCLLSVAH